MQVVLSHPRFNPPCGAGAAAPAALDYCGEMQPARTDTIVKISDFFKRLVQGDHATRSRGGILRAVVVWLFIALVALFLTHPSTEPPSRFERPIPLPAELGLEAPPT